VRVIVDVRVPEDEDWPARVEAVFRSTLAEFGLIAPADASDAMEIISAITADMSEQDLSNFKCSVRYVARQFGGPVASVNVLRQGYVRLRLRGYDFGDLHSMGQGIVVTLMKRHGPGTSGDWQLARCEIRERGGGKGFLFAAWLPGVQRFGRYFFTERRAVFIAGLFGLGVMLEIALSFAVGGSGQWQELGLRLGAPMLVSSAVLVLERYAQWLDQRSFRLVWSPHPRRPASQRLNVEA
jgi:hypothetical protein